MTIMTRNCRTLRAGSMERILIASRNKPTEIGPKLGVLCIRGKVPAAFVGAVVGTTEQTVYRWFYGETDVTNQDRRKKVIRLTEILRYAISHTLLPVGGDYGRIEERLTAAAIALKQELLQQQSK